MGIVEILALIDAAAKYGVPAITDAIAAFKASNGVDPTVEEVLAIMEGVEPPTDFSK